MSNVSFTLVQVLELRRQAAIVRSLLDEVERMRPEPWVVGQLVEELSRLGLRVLQAARALDDAAEALPVADVPSGPRAVAAGSTRGADETGSMP